MLTYRNTVMDDAIDTFVAFTGATPDIARRYLEMTENNGEQAIQLYFDSPDLASGVGQGIPSPAPPIPSSTRPPLGVSAGLENSRGVVHLDDDDEDMADVNDEAGHDEATSAAAIAQAADYEDDEAIARRMQEELYAGGDSSGGGFGGDGVRAPIERRTETLVGGPGGDWVRLRIYHFKLNILNGK
jgi:hypothetical protein